MNTLQLSPINEFSISTVPVARCADGNGTLTPLFFSDHILDIARANPFVKAGTPLTGGLAVSTRAANGSVRLCPPAM